MVAETPGRKVCKVNSISLTASRVWIGTGAVPQQGNLGRGREMV